MERDINMIVIMIIISVPVIKIFIDKTWGE